MIRPYAPPAGPVQIVHADKDILVAVKPSGLLSVPGRGPEKADCLPARLEQGFGPLLIVHRLDMETSGLMVLARTRNAQSFLSREFAERRVNKRYVAGIAGILAGDFGAVLEPIAADWPNRPLQKIDHENGKPCETRYKVLDHEDGNTVVLLTPVTGRSHQLRVHMKAIGHPILGDELYAPPEVLAAAPRLLLHASELGFAHPGTGEWKRFVASAPF